VQTLRYIGTHRERLISPWNIDIVDLREDPSERPSASRRSRELNWDSISVVASPRFRMRMLGPSLLLDRSTRHSNTLV
jgi:hypothetical protein